MSARARILAFFTILMLTLSVSAVALAQTTGPDPNSPVKQRTATSEPDEDPVEEETADQRPQASPVSGDGTPIATTTGLDLAAMTLDSNSIPEGWVLIAENYSTVEQVSEGLIGLMDPDDLAATGMQSFYQSYYANIDGNTLRTYVIAFETVEGVQAGFDLLEDEDVLVPNGDMQDLPPLDGVGEEPAEITSGTIQNTDGTQDKTYDITFRIDRLAVGAAMETRDGTTPDREVVQQLAVELAARVEAVLAGDPVEGVEYALSGQVISPGGTSSLVGYQTAVETFLIIDPDALPEGFVAGYTRAGSYAPRVTTFLPHITVGLSAFESADDVEAALDNQDSIMPSYPLLEELDSVEIDRVDRVLAFSFSAPEGGGEIDSVRVFMQIDDHLVTIDVQGLADFEEAEAVAIEIAEAQVDCVVNTNCEPLELDI